MNTEISDRLKYFDNLCNGNNLQVHVNPMMCSKLKELLEVTVHCRWLISGIWCLNRYYIANRVFFYCHFLG